MKKQKRVILNGYIRQELKAALKKEARLTGRSMASLIEELVEKQYQKPKQ